MSTILRAEEPIPIPTHGGPDADTNHEVLQIESCHSIWFFDEGRGRFRRLLRGTDHGEVPVATEWRPYFGVDQYPGSQSFAVWLNPEGTRLLRSWRHLPGCQSCDERTTR
jgi:hypothetical protein